MNGFGMLGFWVAGLVLIGGVVGLCVREVQLFRRGQSIVSKRQLIFRIVGGAITLALICKVMGGVLHVRPGVAPDTFVTYWLECAGLASLTVFVALVDAWSVCAFRRRCRRELNGRAGRLYAQVMLEAEAARRDGG